MRISISSTTKIVKLNGVPARIWQGETESGIKVHCYITRIAIDRDETRTEEFECDLEEHEAPRLDLRVIPLNLLI
jgi:hypothetical protein